MRYCATEAMSLDAPGGGPIRYFLRQPGRQSKQQEWRRALHEQKVLHHMGAEEVNVAQDI